ncbi:hypothetical protein [Neomoorella humiferrea]|uniref:hypothetical protein n=2 Tax=Neomoorella humiferrea TaxID=676965 RepID=UPI0031B575DE
MLRSGRGRQTRLTAGLFLRSQKGTGQGIITRCRDPKLLQLNVLISYMGEVFPGRTNLSIRVSSYPSFCIPSRTALVTCFSLPERLGILTN